MDASDWFALGSLLVSGWAFRMARRAEKRTVKREANQDQKLALEQMYEAFAITTESSSLIRTAVAELGTVTDELRDKLNAFGHTKESREMFVAQIQCNEEALRQLVAAGDEALDRIRLAGQKVKESSDVPVVAMAGLLGEARLKKTQADHTIATVMKFEQASRDLLLDLPDTFDD